MVKKLLTLALVVVATPLTDLFIYDSKTCKMEDHIVANHILVIPEQNTIRLFMEMDGGMDVEDIQLQNRHEYQIRRGREQRILESDGKYLKLVREPLCRPKK